VRQSYWIETLGCPKNDVDSDHIAGSLLAEGYVRARSPEDADLVVVNTCAFIEAARAESVETILDLAARAGEELAASIPEVDVVVDVGVPVTVGAGPRWRPAPSRVPSLDLMKMPRPAATDPWAYVKIAEGCDRACGFCAIPSFRGPQRSRDDKDILAEVDQLGVKEVVLVAQDLASYGRDFGRPGSLAALVGEVAARVERVRLLYLYPSSLSDELLNAIAATGVPYFDLSLQHVSRPLVRRMRRYGDGTRFLERIAAIRALAPDAALRSSFILGYPGETEEDHDALLEFLDAAQLDWVGFFTFSEEEGTYAASLDGAVDPELALERLRECAELQDAITARRRAALIGSETTVLIDRPGSGRSHREAPIIDGVVRVPIHLAPGTFTRVQIIGSEGPDLVALPVDAPLEPAAVVAGAAAR
jgi:ribosomal protein S12 methylthiotransferase